MSLFSSNSGSSASSEEVKQNLMRQVQQEAAMTNARSLIAKVNEHCFDRCIPNPGSSISSSEQTCLSSCMEKYISMWNTTSRTYVTRVSEESKKMGQDSVAINSLAHQ